MGIASVRCGRIAVAGLIVAIACLAVGSAPASFGAGVAGTTVNSLGYLVALRDLAPDPGVSARTALGVPGMSPQEIARRDAAHVVTVDRAVARLEGRVAFRAGYRYYWALQGFSAQLDAAQVGTLREDPAVAAVAPIEPLVPADAQVVPTGVERVHAQPVADGGPVMPDLSGINVAVLDTGIRHLVADPELNVRGGVDCSRPGGGSAPSDWKDVSLDGHGTHVAGITGARDNGTGVVGVAPGVALWSVRVFGMDAQQRLIGSTATVVCGIDWVVRSLTGAHPIDIANMSVVGPNVPPAAVGCPDAADPEHHAVCTAWAAGITFVAAAGNEGSDAAMDVPAAYGQVITVSALSDYDGKPGGLASVACPGDGADDTFAPYSNYGHAVDLLAPGSCIRSLNLSGTGPAPAGTKVMSGTSMAAPHVTGAAARYIALHRADPAHAGAGPSPEQVRSALRASAGFDWTTASDPDGAPDRLLDVASLTADPSVSVAAFPRRVSVPIGASARTVDVELVRRGLYAGPVALSVSGLPAGVTASLGTPTLVGLNDAGIASTLQLVVAEGTPDGESALTITATPASGASATATVGLRVDRTAPTVSFLSVNLVGGSTLGSTARVRVAWAGGDPPPGVIARFEAQSKTGTTGAWKSIGPSTATGTWTGTAMKPRTDVQFRVRATDDSRNAGDWTSIALRAGIRESTHPTITYSAGDWTTVARVTASGGQLAETRHPGASARFTFSGVGVAWVAPTGPTKGTATVTLDGKPFAVNLHADVQHPRILVFASGPLVAGRHTVVITDTSGTVDLDAVLVLG